MIERCFVNIRQRPFRGMLILLLFSLLTALVVFGTLTYDAAVILKKDTYKQIGTSIMVSSNKRYNNSLKETREKLGVLYNDKDFFPPLSKEAFNKILEIDGVSGIEAMNINSLLDALPVNFKNSHLYTGVDPYTQVNQSGLADDDVELYSNAVNIIGGTSIENFEYFRRNLSTLCDGVYPSTDNPGVIISTILAEENGLQVGGTMEFKAIFSEFNDNNSIVAMSERVSSVKIVGIYSTQLYFDVCETNADGPLIFKLSPYNTLFSDYETTAKLNEKNAEIRFFEIYIDSPEKLDKVLAEIKNLPIDWEKYEAYNTDVYNTDIIAQTEKFLTSTLAILIISIIAGIAIFGIVINSFSDSKEISVLLLIGERKSSIIKGKLFEYAVFALVSLPIGVLVGYQVARLMQTILTPTLSFAGNITFSFVNGSHNYIPGLSVALTTYNIILAIIYVLLLLLIVLITTIYRTYRLNNKNGFVKPE